MALTGVHINILAVDIDEAHLKLARNTMGGHAKM